MTDTASSPGTPQPSIESAGTPFFQNPLTLARVIVPFSPADLALFAEMLMGLVRAKLPLPQALKLLAQDADCAQLRKCLESVQSDVDAGLPLGDALRKHPGKFPELFTSLIDQGYASNDLHAALVELVREYRSQMRFREALWSQLLSPIATATCLGTILFFLLAYNLPLLYVKIYESLKLDLPIPTRIVLWFGNVLHHAPSAAAFAAILIATIGGMVIIMRHHSAQRWVQLLLLSLPIAGPFLMTMLIGRFCRLMSILLYRRMPLDVTLQVAANCFGFIPMQQELNSIRERVVKGAPLHDAMRQSLLFPATLTQFIEGGQMHGDLPQTLSRLADIYEERAELHGAKVRMTIFIIAQIAVGLIALFLIMSILLPMLNIQNALQRK